MSNRTLIIGTIAILAAGAAVAILTSSTDAIPFLSRADDAAPSEGATIEAPGDTARVQAAQPRGDQAAGNRPSGDQAAGDQVAGNQPFGDQAAGDQAAEAMLEIGEFAPDFELVRLDGGTFSLRAHRGRVVLVNFWATWCEPCRDEMPDLQQLWETYRDDGLLVVGVSLDDGHRSLIEEFHQTFPVEYPLLLNGRAIAAQYGADHFVPSTFVIGRDGRLLDRHVGALTRDSFEDRIEALL